MADGGDQHAKQQGNRHCSSPVIPVSGTASSLQYTECVSTVLTSTVDHQYVENGLDNTAVDYATHEGSNAGSQSRLEDWQNPLVDSVVNGTDTPCQAEACSIPACAVEQEDLMNNTTPDSLPSLSELAALLASYQKMAEHLDQEHADFIRQMDGAKAEIERKAEQLYSAVDNRANELLMTTKSIRQDQMAEFEMARQKVQAKLDEMSRYRLFAEQLVGEDNPRDMVHFAAAVDYATQQFSGVPEQVAEFLQRPEANNDLDNVNAFTQLNINSLLQRFDGNLVGHVSVSETVERPAANDMIGACTGESAPYLPSVQLVSVVSVGVGVQSLAFYAGNLCVIHERSSVVEIYDTDSANNLNQIVVEQLNFPSHIVSSECALSIFVSDSQVSGIFRVKDITSANATIQLTPLPHVPTGLSTTICGNLVLTFAELKCIHILSANEMTVLRTVSLESLSKPVTAVVVPGDADNGIVVCDETEKGFYWYLCGHCIEGPSAHELEKPVQLSSLSGVNSMMSDTFCNYVALRDDESIVLIDMSFCFGRKLIGSYEGLHDVKSIALGTKQGRLAAGQCDGNVKVFQVMQTHARVEVNFHQWL